MSSATAEIDALLKAKNEALAKAGVEFDAKIKALEDKARAEKQVIINEVAKKILDNKITSSELAKAGVKFAPPKYVYSYTDPVTNEVYIDNKMQPKPQWFVAFKASRKGKSQSELAVLNAQFARKEI